MTKDRITPSEAMYRSTAYSGKLIPGKVKMTAKSEEAKAYRDRCKQAAICAQYYLEYQQAKKEGKNPGELELFS